MIFFLQIISLISIFVGAMYAFTELNFKKFWALAAISNLGYIILALSLGTVEGFLVAIFYLFLYLLNTLFVWLVFLHVQKKAIQEFYFSEFLTKLINWMSFAGAHKPLALALIFVLFSLAGLPPGLGFLPKG